MIVRNPTAIRHAVQRLAPLLYASITLCMPGIVAARPPCRITVREVDSDWVVPLVELRTTDQHRWVSDNAGVVAFDLEEAFGQETWLTVASHGYEVPADGFGFRGVRVTPESGGDLTVQVRRTSIARRVGRLTGAGLFSQSRRLDDLPPAVDEPIVGCDSVQNAFHNQRLYWFWGDTTIRRYPLGIFHASGATSEQKPPASLAPPLAWKFDYFRDENARPRGVAPMPGEGPTWLTGVASIPDQTGRPRLVASYMKVKPPLDVYRWGLAVWDEQQRQFRHEKTVWEKSTDANPPSVPEGHAVIWRDEREMEWLLFGNPFPKLRCPARFEAWADASTWESLDPPRSLAAVGTEPRVSPHAGSIAWNPFRQRWIALFAEHFGKPSFLGEIWYAESKSPQGPWGPAVKVLSHNNYSFYNPKLHPEFAAGEGRYVYFEGTYTSTFADRPEPTPGYEYNQILYQLDLDNAGLAGARVD
jgi:hypothetical protein